MGNAQVVAGYECTGAAYSRTDLTSLNTAKTEAGCMSAVFGSKTGMAASGGTWNYNCITMKNCPGPSCTCEARVSCASSSGASTSKSCIYDLTSTDSCPADSLEGSSASGAFGSSMMLATSIVLSSIATAVA